MARRMLIDCDPGLDDALAVYAALASDAVSVSGITTVFGSVPVRQASRNVQRLLQVFKVQKSIPVREGSNQPLKESRLPRRLIQGRNGLGGLELPVVSAALPFFESSCAIADLLRGEGRSVAEVLVALGPLTNLAHAFATGPESMRRLESVVVMAGTLMERGQPPGTDFNLASDGAAARCVLGSGMRLRWVPSNVAASVAIPLDWPDQFQRDAPAGPVTSAIHGLLAQAVRRVVEWGALVEHPLEGGGAPLPEAVAMALALDPALGRWHPRRLVVEQRTRSGRLGIAAGPPNVELCESIDAQAVRTMLWQLWLHLASPSEGNRACR